MPHLLLLQPDPRSRGILRSALEGTFRLALTGSWRDLERRLARDRPLGCVLDIFDPRVAVPLTALRQLRQKHPFTALLICSDFTGREMELYHLGRVSVNGVLRLEEDPSPRTVREVVRGALASALSERVIQTATADLPPLAQEVARWAIEHAAARPQVSDLAAALALSPRSLLREMRKLDLAPPRHILLWGRLIHATHLLESLDETVENAAFSLGYATGGTLRKALKRHVGCSPTTLLRRGGLSWILGEFQRKGLRRSRSGRDRWANTGSPRWKITPFAGRMS